MPFETFIEFYHQIEPLLHDGYSIASVAEDASPDLEKASTLLDEAEKKFPNEQFDLTLYRLRITAQRGDVAEVMNVLENALIQGLAFPYFGIERALGALIDVPELQPLRQRHAAQYEHFIHTARGKVLVLEPEIPHVKPPLLMTLHGNGGRVEWDVEYYKSVTAQGWRVVMPQSVLRIFEDRYIWGGQELVLAQVPRVLAELPEQHPFDESQVVVAGMSAGALAAVDLALSGAIPVRGFIVQAPGSRNFPFTPEKYIPLIDASRARGLRAYVIIGEEDTLCYAETIALVKLLNERGLPCTVEVHEGLGHEFPSNFDRILTRGLQFILQDANADEM